MISLDRPANPFLTGVEQYHLDVRGANALLDPAGYSRSGGGIRKGRDGAPLSFELLLSNDQAPLAEVLKAALAKIGGDPDLLRQLFSSKGAGSLTGASGNVNPEFDDLADRQLATFDEAKRKDLVAKMQRIVARDLPVLALYYPDEVLVFRKPVLDRWYFVPGQFPPGNDNKQLFVTGVGAGTKIRPTK